MRIFMFLALVLGLCGVAPAFAADPGPLHCPTAPGKPAWPKAGEVKVIKGTEIWHPTSVKFAFVASDGGYRPFELFVGRQEMHVAGNVPNGYYAPPQYGFSGHVTCDYSYEYHREEANDGTVSVSVQFASSAADSSFRQFINCSIAKRRCGLSFNEIRGENDGAAFLEIEFNEDFPDGEICLMGGWSGPPYPDPSINLYVDGVRMAHISHESLKGREGAVPCQGAGSAAVLAAMKRAKRVDYERVRQPGDRWYSDPNHDHEFLTERTLKGLSDVCDLAAWLLKHAVLSDDRLKAELKLRPAADALLQQPPRP